MALTQKPAKKGNGGPNAVLQSDAFKGILTALDQIHPARQLLPVGATIEHRAMYQIRCEEFERIVRALRATVDKADINSLQSTYEPPVYAKPTEKES